MHVTANDLTATQFIYRDSALQRGSINGGEGSRILCALIPDSLDCWSLRILVTKLIPELELELC